MVFRRQWRRYATELLPTGKAVVGTLDSG